MAGAHLTYPDREDINSHHSRNSLYRPYSAKASLVPSQLPPTGFCFHKLLGAALGLKKPDFPIGNPENPESNLLRFVGHFYWKFLKRHA